MAQHAVRGIRRYRRREVQERDNPSPSSLTGVGVGLIWNPVREFFAELYFAKGLDDVPDPPSSHLQDESLYFRLIYRPSWFQ
jgi:hypothetical protein